MSFINYENIKEVLSCGENVDFYTTFKVGDRVDYETVSLLIDSFLNEESDLLQKSDIFAFVDNDLGERLPCYITFSKEKDFWIFRGACFEDSIINRCGGFQYAPQTIGDYCLEKFNNAYLKAITKMYSGNKDTHGKDIDDYINCDALTAAGYFIFLYGDRALDVFNDMGAEFCREEFYSSVSEILKHKDDIYEGESLKFIK